MPRTESPGRYPLLVVRDGQGGVQAVHQGTVGRIGFSTPRMQAGFVDAVALAPRGGAARLAGPHTGWHLDVRVPAARVAVVAAPAEGVMNPTVRECLELVHATGMGSSGPAPRPPQGVLAGVAPDTPISALDWPRQVEVAFLQAWIREPEWLLFDGLFDHAEAAQVGHLPRLFHQRFPMRAISFLGTAMPPLPGVVPAQTLWF